MSRHLLRPALRHVLRFPRRAGAGGAAFAGAYDAIPDLAAVYGMRRTLTSYPADSPLIRLRRSSDNAEQDIGALANGDLDTDAAAAFIGGGSGFITTWYDQSGDGHDATQATAANQPLYVADGQNGRPVARFDGVDDYLLRENGILGATHMTVLAMSKFRLANAFRYSICGEWNVGGASAGTNEWLLAHGAATGSGTPRFLIESGSTAFGLASSVTHINMRKLLIGRHDGANIELYIDGALDVSADAAVTKNQIAGRRFYIGTFHNNGTPSNYAAALDTTEIVIANAAWSVADREAAEAAANAYWPAPEEPFGLEIIDRSANLGDLSGNIQGVAYDGTNYYCVTTPAIYKFTRDPSTNVYTLVTSRSVGTDDPTSKTQINGMNYHDGYLWIGASNYNNSPKKGWVVQYDPTDLSHVATYEVDNHWSEGGAWRNDPVEGDEFWAVFTDWDRISRWRLVDGSFVKVDDYLAPLIAGRTDDALYQGAAWYGDIMITQMHSVNDDTSTHFHRWTGTEFEPVQRILMNNTLGEKVGQGIHWEAVGEIMLFAERDPDGNGQTIVRASFTDDS